MAFANPPSSLGPGVISVSVANDKPAIPRTTVWINIQNNQNNPNDIASKANPVASWSTRLRLANL
jgi:hypothetical protein